MDEETKRQRIRAKNRYNFVTAVLFLLKTWFLYFGVALLLTLAIVYYPLYGMRSLLAFGRRSSSSWSFGRGSWSG